MRTLTCSLHLLVFGLAGMTVQAADDLVALTSGNRMTGEIERLSRGELHFAIDGAGTVAIDWANIEALRSRQHFDVELVSGERLRGTLALESSGILEIQTATGVKAVDTASVVRIYSVLSSFTDRLTGAVDLGLDFLTANDEIDWTLNVAGSHRTVNHLTAASISSLLRRHSSETTQRRNDLQIGSRRFLERRWFALGQFEAEEDRELDLDSRLLIGAALGRTLVQTNKTVFALYGGVDLAREKYRGHGTHNEPEVLAAIEWDLFDLGGDTTLLMEATTYFGLDDSRVRFELESSLRRDIFSNFYWSLNLYESYNSDPPAGLEKSDLGMSLTIGRSF